MKWSLFKSSDWLEKLKPSLSQAQLAAAAQWQTAENGDVCVVAKAKFNMMFFFSYQSI